MQTNSLWTNKKNGWSLGKKMMIWQWSKWKLRFDIFKMQENNKKSQNTFCTVLYSISKQRVDIIIKEQDFFSIFAFLIVFLIVVVSSLGFRLLVCWSTILILNLQQFLLVVGTNMLVYRPFGQKMLSTNFACGFLNNQFGYQFQVPLAIEHMP